MSSANDYNLCMSLKFSISFSDSSSSILIDFLILDLLSVLLKSAILRNLSIIYVFNHVYFLAIANEIFIKLCRLHKTLWPMLWTYGAYKYQSMTYLATNFCYIAMNILVAKDTVVSHILT